MTSDLSFKFYTVHSFVQTTFGYLSFTKSRGQLSCVIISPGTSSLQQPELVKLKEEESRINSKIKSSEKDLKKRKEEKKKHTDEIKKLQNDLHDLTRQLSELHEKVQDGGEKLQLADSQLETYHRM